MNNDNLNEEILKDTPPIGVSTLSVLGVPLSDMVYLMTIVYIRLLFISTLFTTYLSTMNVE